MARAVRVGRRKVQSKVEEGAGSGRIEIAFRDAGTRGGGGGRGDGPVAAGAHCTHRSRSCAAGESVLAAQRRRTDGLSSSSSANKNILRLVNPGKVVGIKMNV